MWWFLALACAPSEPVSFEIGDVTDPGDDLDDTGMEDTDTPPDRRTFAAREVVASLVTNPNPMSSQDGVSLTASTKLLDWERDGTAVTWAETVCGMEQSEVFGTLTSFPPAFVDAIEPVLREAWLDEAAVGAELSAGPWVELVGVALNDPSDPLPTDADDPHVVDSDRDGHPGVTVHVDQSILGEGDVYVIQRTTTTLTGVMVADDRVEGYVEATTEQVVLGASTWWLELDTDTRPDPDPTHSWFVWQEIDAADCGLADQALPAAW